jgi:hypothetical protein
MAAHTSAVSDHLIKVAITLAPTAGTAVTNADMYEITNKDGRGGKVLARFAEMMIFEDRGRK